MKLIPQRFLPVVQVERDVLLNGNLTPKARLLYVTLLADDSDLRGVARLAGFDEAMDMRPYLTELCDAGLVDISAPPEVSASTAEEAHRPVQPDPDTHEGPAAHECVPCSGCGRCSCAYIAGQCRVCSDIAFARGRAEKDIARWRSQVGEGRIYATGSTGSRLHRWNCNTLPSVEESLELLEREAEAARRNGFAPDTLWRRLPQLHTAEELRKRPTRRRNCATCGPDPL